MVCVLGASHQPKDAARARERKYWLFEAAWSGCLACVKHPLEDDRINPQEISNNYKLSALDWALYGQEQGQAGADEVVAYLQRAWPDMLQHIFKKQSGGITGNPNAQLKVLRKPLQTLPRAVGARDASAKGLIRGHQTLRSGRQAPRIPQNLFDAGVLGLPRSPL